MEEELIKKDHDFDDEIEEILPSIDICYTLPVCHHCCNHRHLT